MNQYLLADENREAIRTHNEDLVETVTRTVGRASYTSHDFNRNEEWHQLDAIVEADDIDSQTARLIATRMYGSDDDALVRRVRSMLSFGSSYQKTLRNGTAVVARLDGTLRVTRTADEYGTLVTENLALKGDRIKKSVTRAAKQIDRLAAAAVDKVPELAEQMAELRVDMKASLGSVFTRQLELLSGDD